jgi:hypothetical protein
MQKDAAMKIFVSFTHEDREQVEPIVARLTKAGFDVWDAERELFLGDNFYQEMARALDQSNVMIVFLSHNSMKSRSVPLEIGYALGSANYSGRVIAVELAPNVDMPWILRKFRPIRLYEHPTTAVRRLITRVRLLAKAADNAPKAKSSAVCS